MKQYTFTDKETRIQDGLDFEKSETISKSIETLGGSGEWKSLYGAKLMVDPSGIVIKGPDLMIGRAYEDLKNLNYNDVFTVMRSVARATGATNKSHNPDDPYHKNESKQILKEAREWLEKTIKIRKSEKENMYISDPLFRKEI